MIKFWKNTSLFDLVMIWTIITSVFAWLPLARIIGRPDEYYWGILGLSGEGTDGPYWIFILLLAYVLTMLFSAYRGPRRLFYPLLVIWHILVTATFAAGILAGGQEATIQGQGLHWEFPMWIFIIPCALFAAAALVWCIKDYKKGEPFKPAKWSAANTKKLAVSIGLMIVALVLFRAGTNYNWVTALAIIVTVVQWIVLVESFKSIPDIQPPMDAKKPMSRITLLFLLSAITFGPITAIAQDSSAVHYDAELAKSLGADEYGMRSYVLVVLKTGPNRVPDGEERTRMFQGHMANIQRLANEEKLVFAGPLDGVDGWRGIFIFATPDIETAKDYVSTDPVIINGEMVAEYHQLYGSAGLMLMNEISRKISRESP